MDLTSALSPSLTTEIPSLPDWNQACNGMNPLGRLGLRTHLDICPCITQGNSPTVFINIRKRIIDMREMLKWDLLRREFTSINTPVH